MPNAAAQRPIYPAPSAVLELLKPITWFPPMWAFTCGVVSSGAPILANWYIALAGIVLAGPLVCAMSQAINDWYDRDVDAINEPHRPIPSGRIPGKWGLYIAGIWSVLSLLVAATLGTWVVIATVAGLFFAWAYSAPPLRLKRNGWLGNAACGFSYESLAWITGAAAMLGGALPKPEILALALLYGAGAHGIMTQRLQSHQGRPRDGHQLAACNAGTDACRHGRVRHHGAAADRRNLDAVELGAADRGLDRDRAARRADIDDAAAAA